jgi:hypothetical protein
VSPRQLEALRLARLGIPVFPCAPGTKIPATPHAYQDARTDERIINAWWSQADYNIGVCPEDIGLCVVDLDPAHTDRWGKKIVGGEVAWLEAQGEFGFVVRTHTVKTPRGRHLYFKGSLPPSVNRVVPGAAIDTRGRTSYVLVSPSIVDGKLYQVIDDANPAPLPAWIVDRVNAPLPKKSKKAAA